MVTFYYRKPLRVGAAVNTKPYNYRNAANPISKQPHAKSYYVIFMINKYVIIFREYPRQLRIDQSPSY
ncbi:hypothetical protein BpHYR1_001822 [Brachionus plicatilis]|uniref:Uncharacterized protein n=1 Tax=Brachionus plicatilis TaxID=10195 RepID=A0A3M7SKL4_BRAPC|nr:hypothetical protein BpHYR1_001822 [Brachionus plicatilis]